MRGPRGSPASAPNADGWPPPPARTGLTPQPAPHPLPPSPPQSTARHCPQHGTDAPGGSGKGAPATSHAYQDNSDGRLPMAPPSATTATTAGPAPAPPSPWSGRGRPPRSARSGGWRRRRCWSGRRRRPRSLSQPK